MPVFQSLFQKLRGKCFKVITSVQINQEYDYESGTTPHLELLEYLVESLINKH